LLHKFDRITECVRKRFQEVTRIKQRYKCYYEGSLAGISGTVVAGGKVGLSIVKHINKGGILSKATGISAGNQTVYKSITSKAGWAVAAVGIAIDIALVY
jgi:hypothetical protein